jgi:hypothetical protein
MQLTWASSKGQQCRFPEGHATNARNPPAATTKKRGALHGNGNFDLVESGWRKVTGKSPLEAHCNSHHHLTCQNIPHSVVAVVPAFAHLLHVGALFLVVPLFVAKKRRGLLNGL